MKCYNMVQNQTLKFVVPLIGDKITPKHLLNKNFIGGFIGDTNEPKNDGKLLLVYDYPMTTDWAKFEVLLYNFPEFRGDYDYPDKNYVVYKFNIDDYEEDLQYILQGKYSEVSPESKLKISKFWEVYSKSDLAKRILEKDKSLKITWNCWNKNPKDYCSGDELWFIPDLDNELFDIDKDYN